MSLDLVLRAQRMVTASGEVSGCVGVTDGRIVAIEPIETGLEGRKVVELAADEVLLPGLVDTHVHVNEPGRTQWEGFASATRAAAAGGVTTVIDMPLNCIPPTTTVDALELKRRTARDQVYVDVGFWGGAVPDNLADLRALHEAGVFGFKCFLLPSGVPEFPHLEPAELERAVHEVASFGGLMIVHAEDHEAIDHATGHADSSGTKDVRSYAHFLCSRPRGSENLAIAGLIELARWTGARVHILHLSSSDALPMIASARHEGIALTVETCPHYLSFAAEEIPDGATQFKCCPPIRESGNRELLWAGLEQCVIDCIVTDHSPCTVDLKRLDTGDFAVAWGGIAGLQVGLSAVWTQARRRGVVLADVVRWMAENPARQVGLPDKGRIALGYAADFCVFAPDDEFVVDVARLQHKNPVSAYAGRDLTGVVRSTWLGGVRLDLEEPPRGRLLTRSTP